MEKLLSFIENINNFRFLIKEIKVKDINLINKLYEIGIREKETIDVKYDKKNNKNIVFIISRGAEYAFRIEELYEIYGEINE